MTLCSGMSNTPASIVCIFGIYEDFNVHVRVS